MRRWAHDRGLLGAVFTANIHMPEGGHGSHAFNPGFGATCNPQDPAVSDENNPDMPFRRGEFSGMTKAGLRGVRVAQDPCAGAGDPDGPRGTLRAMLNAGGKRVIHAASRAPSTSDSVWGVTPGLGVTVQAVDEARVVRSV